MHNSTNRLNSPKIIRGVSIHSARRRSLLSETFCPAFLYLCRFVPGNVILSSQKGTRNGHGERDAVVNVFALLPKKVELETFIIS